ncbi:MAG: hypothetical protein GX622_10985, partial [Bacteroidales bacterium]|nr:hypothetical protein [Bacteroidales bacterium]
WAFIGIMIRRQDDYRSIFLTAAVAAVVVAAVLTISFFRRRLAGEV